MYNNLIRYLLIKELKPSADIVFIVTASLNKDMTGSNDTFRSNALRVMCQITDAQMLLQVERFIKQACVDKQVTPTLPHLYVQVPVSCCTIAGCGVVCSACERPAAAQEEQRQREALAK